MKRRAVTLAAVAAAAAAASAATAATGWRPFASATDSGDYGAYAHASADVQMSRGLGIRVAGKTAKVSWYLSCEGEAQNVRPGQIVDVSVPAAIKCSLSGTADTDSAGRVTVELLRR